MLESKNKYSGGMKKLVVKKTIQTVVFTGRYLTRRASLQGPRIHLHSYCIASYWKAKIITK
jgi:hypothetical protein